MGPQLNRCGNSAPTGGRAGSINRFNGAATKPLRKRSAGKAGKACKDWLQWGRN